MQDERRDRGAHRQGPQNQEGARALHDATFLAPRSLALRERGLASISAREGTVGLLVRRCQTSGSKNARLTCRSSSE